MSLFESDSYRSRRGELNFSGNVEPTTKLLSVGLAVAITRWKPFITDTPSLNFLGASFPVCDFRRSCSAFSLLPCSPSSLAPEPFCFSPCLGMPEHPLCFQPFCHYIPTFSLAMRIPSSCLSHIWFRSISPTVPNMLIISRLIELSLPSGVRAWC